MASFPPTGKAGQPIRELEQGIVSTCNSEKAKLQGLKAPQQAQEQAVKDPQTEGDALYWPIYNLDLKNLNAKDLMTLMRDHKSPRRCVRRVTRCRHDQPHAGPYRL